LVGEIGCRFYLVVELDGDFPVRNDGKGCCTPPSPLQFHVLLSSSGHKGIIVVAVDGVGGLISTHHSQAQVL